MNPFAAVDDITLVATDDGTVYAVDHDGPHPTHLTVVQVTDWNLYDLTQPTPEQIAATEHIWGRVAAVSSHLQDRGLWNDPGSGRFVRRGWSSLKWLLGLENREQRLWKQARDLEEQGSSVEVLLTRSTGGVDLDTPFRVREVFDQGTGNRAGKLRVETSSGRSLLVRWADVREVRPASPKQAREVLPVRSSVSNVKERTPPRISDDELRPASSDLEEDYLRWRPSSPDEVRESFVRHGDMRRRAMAQRPLLVRQRDGVIDDKVQFPFRLQAATYGKDKVFEVFSVLPESAKADVAIDVLEGPELNQEVIGTVPLIGPVSDDALVALTTRKSKLTVQGDHEPIGILFGNNDKGLEFTWDGRMTARREPIDWATVEADTIFLSPGQAVLTDRNDLQAAVDRARSAGKTVQVLRADGVTVNLDEFLSRSSAPSQPDTWSGPYPYEPDGNRLSMYADLKRNQVAMRRPVDEFVAELREVREGAADRIAVRVPIEAVAGIVQAGGLKNQHQSRSSKGWFSPTIRREAELTLTGVPLQKVPTKLRPVSGYIQGNIGGRPSRVSQYGNFIFRLDPSLASRSALTFGDSLGVADPTFEYARGAAGTSATRGKRIIPTTVMDAHGIAIPLEGEVTDDQLLAATERHLPQRYVEVLIFGGVTLSDVTAIKYDPRTRRSNLFPADDDEWQEQAAEYTPQWDTELREYAANPILGIKVEVPQDVADEVPDAMRALADAGVDVVVVP